MHAVEGFVLRTLSYAVYIFSWILLNLFSPYHYSWRSLSRQPSLGFRRMTSSRLSDGISTSVSGISDLATSGGEQQAEPSTRISKVLSTTPESPSQQSRENSMSTSVFESANGDYRESPFGAVPSPEGRVNQRPSGNCGTTSSAQPTASCYQVSAQIQLTAIKPGQGLCWSAGSGSQILWSNSRRDLEVAIQSQKVQGIHALLFDDCFMGCVFSIQHYNLLGRTCYGSTSLQLGLDGSRLGWSFI